MNEAERSREVESGVSINLGIRMPMPDGIRLSATFVLTRGKDESRALR
jgi:hypothetical protein